MRTDDDTSKVGIDERTINTGGGDHAGESIDKRSVAALRLARSRGASICDRLRRRRSSLWIAKWAAQRFAHPESGRFPSVRASLVAQPPSAC